MGTSNSTAELVKKLSTAGDGLLKKNVTGVTRSAQVYKESVLTEARADTGGDGRLSRWGRNGLKLNAGYEVTGTTDAKAILTARPMGPWKVLEHGSDPHLIVPGLTRRQRGAMELMSMLSSGRGGYDAAALAASARGNRNNRGGRRRRPVPLNIGGNLRAYARHPGSKGKGTWSTGIRRGTKPATAAYRKAQTDALAEVFI